MTRRSSIKDYRFVGDADRFDTRIPVRLTNRPVRDGPLGQRLRRGAGVHRHGHSTRSRSP